MQENFPNLISEWGDGDFKFHFKQKLPNEYVFRDGRKFTSDIPIDTYEGIVVNIESHSYIIDYDRETIFNLYQAALHNEHKKEVITVVFSMVHDEHELISHKINQVDGFTMLIISLKALNQKQTLNNLVNSRQFAFPSLFLLAECLP